MTDPMTPLTEESEALLERIYSLNGRSFPLATREDFARIETAAARRAIERSGVVEALRFLSTYEKDPPEVMYDQWAYIRLLAVVHDVATCALDGVPTAPGWSSRPYAGAIRQALAALPRPEEPSPDRMAGLLARTYALLPPDRVLLVDDEVHEVVARYLDALPRPEESRVERCAFVWKSGTPCGKPKRDSRHKHDSSCLTGGEGHITDMLCHPFTPEVR